MDILNVIEGWGSLIKGKDLTKEEKERLAICEDCPSNPLKNIGNY